MNNAAAIDLGSDCWNAQLYGTVEIASHAVATVSQISTAMYSGIHKVQLAWDLRTLSNRISSVLDSLYQSAEKAEQTPSAESGLNKEQIESAIRSLEYLYETTRRLCETARRKQLTNNSLMAGSLRNIRRRVEEFLDIADWLQAALLHSPSELDAIYAKGREELKSGQVFDLVEERALTSHR